MKISCLAFFAIAVFMTTMPCMSDERCDFVLLKATYTPVEGADPEYGQGAIERNELQHREIERFVWLVLIDPDAPTDPISWQHRLNDAVDPKYGSFTVGPATEEEWERVRAGEITFQR